MIRKKAKGLLLSIMLVVASMIFFACKEEVYVKAESINFVEQSIDLLVGEEYTPEIKILPSYASDRSYTLISRDVTALSVEGGSIRALSPAKGVALRVEYNADKTYNDVILVNIYAQSERLDTPTEFKFDGNRFSFVGVNNAESYVLEINGKQINIGNNTEYLFENANINLGDLYDKKLQCSVKAVADGKIFTESEPSEQISVVKMSNVKNVKVEEGVLTFDGVSNASKYDVMVELNGQIYQTVQVDDTEFDLTQLIEDGSNNGAEYTIKIAPNKTDYKIGGVDVFDAEFVDIKYTVVGKVGNVLLNDKVLSWDFVKNAQNYTVELYQSGSLLKSYTNIETNSVTLTCEEYGEYLCKVIANSNQANTATGTKYSDDLVFKILQAPTITTSNNEVKWNSVEDAESYLVAISVVTGATSEEVTKTFIETTKLNVDGFDYGNYVVEVVAYSNAQNVLQSKSSIANWSKLGLVNVKVVNGVLQWEDAVENSAKQYQVTTNNKTVSVADSNSCNLNQFNFTATDTAKEYVIQIQALGSGSSFDSDVKILAVAKLPDARITKFENKVFSLDVVDGASCQVKIYKNDTEIVTLDETLTLNADNLEAGNYVAKAVVTGNGAEILDANNTSATSVKNFIKLASPNLTIDGQSLRVGVVTSAKGYTLTENGALIDEFASPYNLATRLTNKPSGTYTYGAKAIGNNADLLDSNESLINVKKLMAPNASFDKSTLVCTINCDESEESYIANYSVYVNENVITADQGDNTIDCSAYIKGEGEYTIQVVASPKQSSDADFDLILSSDKSDAQVVNKLSGKCGISVDSGNLIVTPKNALQTDKEYALTLTIAKGAQNQVKLTATNYSDGKFIVKVVDSQYNPLPEFEGLFVTGGQYSVHTLIEPIDSDSELASDDTESDQKLVVLGKVNDVSKQGQAVKFNEVTGANNYKAIVTLNTVATEIELKDKYQDYTTGYYKVNIDELKDLMQDAGLEYLENTDYKIKIIATGIGANVLSNYKVETELVFQFLPAPTIRIDTNSDGKKLLNIVATGADITHNIIIKQGGEIVNQIHNTGNKSINLDNITGIGGGVVEISVNSVYSGTGNLFDSEYSTITGTKVSIANSQNFKTQNGKLVWDVVENAKCYSLGYVENSVSKTIQLANGSSNFVIDEENEICVYDFKGLSDGDKTVTLQVFGEDGNYLNSDIITLNVHKIKAPTISVSLGMICISIEENLAYVSNNGVEFSFGNNNVNDMIVLDQGSLIVTDKYKDVATATKQGSVWTILIDAMDLIDYGTTDLLTQNISAKLYATHEEGQSILNSSASAKSVQGLLAPTNIKLEKSSTTNSEGVVIETAEKIVWTNPSANGENVTGYQVIINYKDVDYKFEVSGNQNYLLMPKCYTEDANGDGKNNYSELDDGKDINGDGLLSEFEQAFLEGDYTITIRAFTGNNDMYVHSIYSNEINITLIPAPKNVRTQYGNITWTGHEKTENYIVRIYKLTDANGQKISETLVQTLSAEGSVDVMDISKIKLDTAIYGVTVQSLNLTDNNVLSSSVSAMTQVVRLPQEAKYIVDDGKIYVKLHKFYTSCVVTLTSISGGKTCTLIKNNDLDKNDPYHFNQFTEAVGFNWLNSTILDTFNDSLYYSLVEIKTNGGFVADGNGYNVEIKLLGNSGDECVLSTLTIATNANKDENGNALGVINRLPTPIASIDTSVRGLVNLKLDESEKSMKYFAIKDANGKIESSLQGVHLYKTTILADKLYVVYMADIVNPTLFYQTYPQLQGTEFNWFKHDGIIYNVVTKDVNGCIQINFNTASYDMYHYFEDNDGNLLKNDSNELITGTSIDLSLGGSFIVQSQMLGDDTRFVSSKICNELIVKRYNPIDLTVYDGHLKWRKQTVTLDETAYLIELSNGAQIVLYDPTKISDLDGFKAMLVREGKNYHFDTISYEYTDEYIEYNNLANKLMEINDSFSGGGFNVSVRAHYTNATSNNVILSQTAPVKSLTIIPQANIGVKDGMLTWNQSLISNDGASGSVYCGNYLLQVFSGTTLKASVNLTVADYELKGRVASIDLNRAYGNFTFTPGQSYTFKLTALGDSTSSINSATTVVENRKILADITSDLVVNEGIVTWTGTGYDEVKVVFEKRTDDGDTTVISYKVVSTTGRYELPGEVTVNGSTYELKSGYAYSFQVRRKGQNNDISGFFSPAVTMQRLSTVTGIKVVDGVLTWDESKYYTNIEDNIKSSEGVTYRVAYMLDDQLDVVMSEELTTNRFELDDLNANLIKVYVYAYHNNHASSDESDNVQVLLSRLQAPTEIKFINNGTVMQWTPSKNGDDVNRYYMIKVSDGIIAKTYSYTIKDGETVGNWNIQIDNVFKGKDVSFAIKTLSKGQGYLLNSLYSTAVEKTISASVAELNLDSDKYAVYWSPINSGKTDTYYIGYTYNNNTADVGDDEVVYEDITSQLSIEDGKCYYYLQQIGAYSNVYVRVVSGTNTIGYDLASQPTRYAGTIQFDIFNSGSGAESDAYIIVDEAHLQNIKYRPSAIYTLGDNISLTTDYKPVESFNGTLNGNDKYIYGYNISGVKEFVGLFKQSNGAKFINIKLSRFDIDVMPQNEDVNISILVSNATNTYFDNIVVTSSSIKLTKDIANTNEYAGNINNSGKIYIGAIAGYASGCTFKNYDVVMDTTKNANIIINAKGGPSIKIYVGSVVGYADESVFETELTYDNTYNTFVMETDIASSGSGNNPPSLKVGAVVGNDATIGGSYYPYKNDI